MQRRPLALGRTLSSLGKLCNIELTLIFAFIKKIMSNLNSAIGMENSFFVFMNLAQQCADLHMGLALVLKHLESQ